MPEGGQDYIVPNMLKIASLPSVLLGVILVLLISASVSTLSSISLWRLHTLHGHSQGKIQKDMSDKILKCSLKRSAFCLWSAPFVVANTDTPILDMMSYSWGIISGSFIAPYILALYCKKKSTARAHGRQFCWAFSSQLFPIFEMRNARRGEIPNRPRGA